MVYHYTRLQWVGVPDGVSGSMLDNGCFGFALEKVEETFRQAYRH